MTINNKRDQFNRTISHDIMTDIGRLKARRDDDFSLHTMTYHKIPTIFIQIEIIGHPIVLKVML